MAKDLLPTVLYAFYFLILEAKIILLGLVFTIEMKFLLSPDNTNWFLSELDLNIRCCFNPTANS